MKRYHKNPRQITEKQFNDLKKWLLKLGDLSGIVHDLNSDEIIGGNQRSMVFDVNKCEIEFTQKLETPDEQGTVALGFIIWEGKKYSYRQVRWDEKKCEQANIVANKSGGSFDFDILANQFEFDELIEWGFKPYELGMPGDIDNLNDEWKGMPEFDNPAKAYKSINVHFETREDCEIFFSLIDQSFTEKTNSIWYPEKQRRNMKDIGFENES
jgi:hypothetical protein